MQVDGKIDQCLLSLAEAIGFFKDITLHKEEFIKAAARYLSSVKNGAHIAQFVKGLDTLGVGELIQKYPGN